MASKMQGLEALTRKLAAIPKATRSEIRKVLEQSADEMVSLAKGLVPKDTGVLASTIEKGPGRHDLSVQVRAGGEATTVPARDGQGEYDYSRGIEFGNSNTPESPFFWNSYRAVKKRAKGRASRAVRKAAKSATGGSS